MFKLFFFVLFVLVTNIELFSEVDKKSKIICITSADLFEKSEFNKDQKFAFKSFRNRDGYSESVSLISKKNNLNIISFILPNGKQFIDEIQKYLNICDGLIVSGGYIPSYFNVKIARDFILQNKPVLGICLGAQIISDIYNNNFEIIQDKIEENGNYNIENSLHDLRIITKIKHRSNYSSPVQAINIQENSILYKINQKDKTAWVNSVHNFGIKEEAIKNGLFISARSAEDNTIKAIEDKSKKFMIGFMPHPEAFFNEASHILENKLEIHELLLEKFLFAVAK